MGLQGELFIFKNAYTRKAENKSSNLYLKNVKNKCKLNPIKMEFTSKEGLIDRNFLKVR